MDLTKHLTTRADDGHASPVTWLLKSTLSFLKDSKDVKTW